MARLKDILAGKSSRLLSVGPDATVLDAALLMNEHKVGSLLVLEAARLRGIITERDILQRIVADRRDPNTTQVREVMTANVRVGQLDTSVEAARVCMMECRIRHLPVLDEAEQLCGMVSIGDLNAFEARGKDMTIHLLHNYIYGMT
jgi:CBS domain-containing protein